jgi:hypothetical protein
LKKNALINSKNARALKDARISLKSVLKNVEKKLHKLAGVSASEHQELLLMFVFALQTPVA